MQEKISKVQLYLAPAKTKRVRFSVRGSRFIATLAPAAQEDIARRVIDKVSSEFPGATHHAYAYRIGSGPAMIERCSDAREPAGTAGPPMLQVLHGGNVSDLVVIATRYFGGTKLGIGGLTRAYRDCARKVLDAVTLEAKEPLATYLLEVAYEDLGTVTRLIESIPGTILDLNYTENVVIHLSIPVREEKTLKNGFESACRGKGKLIEA